MHKHSYALSRNTAAVMWAFFFFAVTDSAKFSCRKGRTAAFLWLHSVSGQQKTRKFNVPTSVRYTRRLRSMFRKKYKSYLDFCWFVCGARVRKMSSWRSSWKPTRREQWRWKCTALKPPGSVSWRWCPATCGEVKVCWAPASASAATKEPMRTFGTCWWDSILAFLLKTHLFTVTSTRSGHFLFMKIYFKDFFFCVVFYKKFGQITTLISIAQSNIIPSRTYHLVLQGYFTASF